MREINLDQLRTLITIADHGSFAKAAIALHLAPPTISLHISELESRVGAQLLSRTKGQVHPTAIGGSLIEHARKLLSDVDHALTDVSRQAQGLAGRVRLGASTGVIAHVLPRALATLAETHPDIDPQITILTSQQTLTRLKAGSLDIGIVALPQANVSGLRIQHWRRDPVLAFLPEAWSPPKHVTANWLAKRSLILNDPGTHLSRLTSQWFARAGQRPEPRIALNYNDAIKSLVAAGYGGTLLPHEEGSPAPDGRIAMRPLRPALWRHLGIAYREDIIAPATAHMLDALWRLQQH